MTSTKHLKALVEERLGIRCADWHEDRLVALADEWWRHGDLSKIAQELTVGETYFFRESAQFDALIDVALPALERRGLERPIRILSAGCSSGEEVFSILMAMEERFGKLRTKEVSVTGIDVNPTAIAKAHRVRYSRWALRATPESVRDRYFCREGDDYRLRDRIREKATFEERNLLAEDPLFWRRGSFDAIFCRNVMIYFSDRAMRALVARFADVLVPGGFLFLGHSETLHGICGDFEPLEACGAFYYARKAPPPPIEATVEAISPNPTPDVDEREGVQDAIRLFHQEQFDDALALLRALQAETMIEPRIKLLSALILCNRGNAAEAEAACREVVHANEQNAEAHYVFGLCREHEGDRAGAVERYREAVRIDPCFALAYLRLGILLRRSGDSNAASSVLGQALLFLPGETDERILLFGGGFRREALMGILQAEISHQGTRV